MPIFLFAGDKKLRSFMHSMALIKTGGRGFERAVLSFRNA
jgi:hypothetical protein